ncbi:hypothetical protein C8N24_4048 [Solirubrobacter pauli]|uniref:Uncharacterized protein n=1 Tax=Solirubrobacter pauli TaxID=166793 RepID=A0A660L3E9_9ACTN|nr:hypothetical protein [Solirubrobacter pauli]RKQ86040.1 hypothetical protein C8N24_4048 [Solirubrobacter pauli]
MSDETPDRDDTAARAAEKRDAQEKDTEPSSPSDRAGKDDRGEEALADAAAAHLPARSD